MAASAPNSRGETTSFQSLSYFGSASGNSPTENNPFAFASSKPSTHSERYYTEAEGETCSAKLKIPHVDSPIYDPQPPQPVLQIGQFQQAGGAGATGFFDSLPQSHGAPSMLWAHGPPPSHESPFSPSQDSPHSQGPPPSLGQPPSQGPPPSHGPPPSLGPPPSQGPPPSHMAPPSQGTYSSLQRDIIDGESPWDQSNVNAVSPVKQFPANEASEY